MKCKALLTLFTLINTLHSTAQSNIKPGIIIILNGSPSSGKSSIAAALGHLYPKPLLAAGIDILIGMTPYKYMNKGMRGSQRSPNKRLTVCAHVLSAAPWGES